MIQGDAALLTRVARRLLYASLFASSFLVFRVGAFTIGDILLVGSLALTALDRRTYAVRPLASWAPAVTFLIVVGGLLASYRAADVSESLLTIIRLVLLITVLPWQARTLLTTPDRLHRAINSWVAGAAVTCAGALLQITRGPESIPGGMVTDAGRYSGFTQNISDTGGIACVAIVMAVAGLSRKTGRGVRIWVLIAVACGLAGLVLSGSVSGMLATAAGIIYLLFRGNIRPGRAIFLGAVSIAGLVLALRLQTQNEFALNPLERLQQTLGLRSFVGQTADLNTSASRLDTMKYGVNAFIENPIFGAGLDPVSAIATNGFAVHDILVAAAYQGGVCLLLALLIPGVSAFRRLWVRKPVQQYVMQANGAFLAALVFALTAPSFFNRYFWVPVALSYVAGVLRRDAVDEPESSKPLVAGSVSRAGR
jgi:hypothetical protein